MLIDISKSLFEKIEKDIQKLNQNNLISIKTFKKDRGVSICNSNEKYLICEQGYENLECEVDNTKELMKNIKKILKREFPRSHKVFYEIKYK